MSARTKTLALAFAAMALACGSAEAQRYHGGGGYYHGHGWGGSGFVLGGIGLGIGLGLGSYYARPYDYRPYDYVVVDRPATVYYNVPPVVSSTVPQQPVANSPPDPVFYPRNGQTAAQVEADRQACNRWATTQPNAVADASVFHRATLACMDGRGYTSR